MLLLTGGTQSAVATAAPDVGPAGDVSTRSAPYNWAVVDYGGNLVRNNNVIGYARQGAGRYEITFNRDIVYCSWTATIADPGTGLVYNPGLVYAARSRDSTWAVHVETRNLGQGFQDFPFHLQVVCPGESDYAVVTGGGVLARGNSATAVQRYGPGRYEVYFDKYLTNCSFVATVGRPYSGVDIVPGLVFTAGGHAGATSVYVETKNLGYGLQDYSFHLQVQCYDGGYAEWGVIDAAGNAVRGNMISGSTRLGVGRYEVYLHRSVYWCSFVATVGDTRNGLVYGPGLVFTATGHSTVNAVYVETKNMGGGLTDLPFHLQISSGC
ncbi:hypothetical protein ACQPYE_18950 [Actinosynnema sp. CA-299493]